MYAVFVYDSDRRKHTYNGLTRKQNGFKKILKLNILNTLVYPRKIFSPSVK